MTVWVDIHPGAPGSCSLGLFNVRGWLAWNLAGVCSSRAETPSCDTYFSAATSFVTRESRFVGIYVGIYASARVGLRVTKGSGAKIIKSIVFSAASLLSPKYDPPPSFCRPSDVPFFQSVWDVLKSLSKTLPICILGDCLAEQHKLSSAPINRILTKKQTEKHLMTAKQSLIKSSGPLNRYFHINFHKKGGVLYCGIS